MGRLCTKGTDCEYHEYDRRLREQFIHGLDIEVMIREISRELTALKYINDATSYPKLMWAPKVEAQRVEKEVLDNIKDAKKFDPFA